MIKLVDYGGSAQRLPEGSECGALFKRNDMCFFRDWDARLSLAVFLSCRLRISTYTHSDVVLEGRVVEVASVFFL